jgi:hypothetical protein
MHRPKGGRRRLAADPARATGAPGTDARRNRQLRVLAGSGSGATDFVQTVSRAEDRGRLTPASWYTLAQVRGTSVREVRRLKSFGVCEG